MLSVNRSSFCHLRGLHRHGKLAGGTTEAKDDGSTLLGAAHVGGDLAPCELGLHTMEKR